MQTFTETFLLVNALEAHALVALTFNVPPQLPAFTVNEAVPCPEIIDHPVGTCHVYVLAPGTNVHVYVVVCDLQTVAAPKMDAGAIGLRLSVAHLIELVPHMLVAFTHTTVPFVQLPDPDNAFPKFTLMLFVPCPLTMVAPVGTDHTKVTSVTLVTE